MKHDDIMVKRNTEENLNEIIGLMEYKEMRQASNYVREQNGDGSQLGICQIHCKMRDDVHEKDLRNFEQFTNYDIQINDNGKYESYRMKTHFIPLLTLPSGQNNLEIRKLLIESKIGMEETDIQRFIWPKRKKGIFILYFSTDWLYMHGVKILPGDVGFSLQSRFDNYFYLLVL